MQAASSAVRQINHGRSIKQLCFFGAKRQNVGIKYFRL